MLTPSESRAVIKRILYLDRASGENVPSSIGGLQERRTVIGERSCISLIESIPQLWRGGIARSKAEAVRVLRRMTTTPVSMAQSWEEDSVVFWAEFTSENLRVLCHVGGEWEAALAQLTSCAANKAAA